MPTFTLMEKTYAAFVRDYCDDVGSPKAWGSFETFGA